MSLAAELDAWAARRAQWAADFDAALQRQDELWDAQRRRLLKINAAPTGGST